MLFLSSKIFLVFYLFFLKILIINASEIDLEESSRSHSFLQNFEDISFKCPELQLFDHENKEYIVQGFLNKFVLVHFWATWSMDYKTELKKILNLKSQLESEGIDGFETILISLDFQDPKIIKDLLKKNGVQSIVYFDLYKSNMQNFFVTSPPASFLIDSTGTVIASVKAPVNWDDKDIAYAIKKMIMHNNELNKIRFPNRVSEKKDFLVLKENSDIAGTVQNVTILN